jgi:hypothetical protein
VEGYLWEVSHHPERFVMGPDLQSVIDMQRGEGVE